MRVAVIGAGGIGGLYGGLLARAGHDVCFLARGQHLRAIQQHGLRVQSAQFGEFTIQAPASADPADLDPGTADLVLFAQTVVEGAILVGLFAAAGLVGIGFLSLWRAPRYPRR